MSDYYPGARLENRSYDLMYEGIIDCKVITLTQIEIPDYREFTEVEKKARTQQTEAWEKASEEERAKLREAWIAMAMNASIEDRMNEIRQEPGPYLFKMAAHPEGEKMLKIYEGFLRRQDRKTIIEFMTRFYSDPDPRIE